MIKLLSMAVIAFGLFSSPASAGTIQCFRAGGASGCIATNGSTENNAKVLHVQPVINEKWERFCKPMLSQPDPDTGVRHYVYAHKGCDMGRDE